MGGYLQLNMADALRMMGPEYDDEALNAYKVALAIDDQRGSWWFHLGIFYKWRGRFQEALEANQKAFARLGPQKGVLWNLAICATALGKGALALEAWEKLGLHGAPRPGDRRAARTAALARAWPARCRRTHPLSCPPWASCAAASSRAIISKV